MNKPKKSANQQNFLISNIFYFLWDINKSNRLQSGGLYSVKQDLYKNTYAEISARQLSG